MKTFFKVILTVLFSINAYAVKPETPEWAWQVLNQTFITTNIQVKFTVWSGDRATYYNVYANTIKIVDNEPTGATAGRMSDSEDQIINKTFNVSILNGGQYDFFVEACNDDGCTKSYARPITKSVTDSTGGTDSGGTDSGGTDSGGTDSGGTDSTSTTTTPEETTLTVIAPENSNMPDKPHIAWLSPIHTKDFTLKWAMWWGKKGNKAKLHINSVLISSKTLDSYSQDKGAQKGKFDIVLSDLTTKGIKSGIHNVYVSLCYDDKCRISPAKALNFTLSSTPNGASSGNNAAGIPPLTDNNNTQDQQAQAEAQEQQNTEANKQEESAKQAAKQATQENNKVKEVQKAIKQATGDTGVLPIAPSMGFVQAVIHKDFEFTLNKWHGIPGTSWKVEHTNKSTGVSKTYDAGEALIEEAEPNSVQSKTVKVAITFSDDANTSRSINRSVYALNITTAATGTTEHTFLPILCNSNGCTKALVAKTVKISKSRSATAVATDETDKRLSTLSFLGLKMDPTTWNAKEKKWGKSLAVSNNGVYGTNAAYTAPTPKNCPNIGTDGKINGKDVMVYYTSWSINDRKHYPRDLDGCNLTGILFAFAYPGPNGRLYTGDMWSTTQIKIGSSSIPESSRYSDDPTLGYFGLFNQLVQFRKEYPHIKQYLSMGGWTWSTYLPILAKYPELRAIFVKDAIELVRTFQFDGLDMDWEFPASAEDRNNLTTLMQELRAALDDAAANPDPGFLFDNNPKAKAVTYKPKGGKFTLSAALAPDAVTKIQYFDLAKLDSILDFAIFMSYDYSGTWNTTTGHQAPLFNSAINGEMNKFWNVSDGIKAYTQGEKSISNPNGFNDSGFPISKMIIGLPYYARGWTTNSSKIYQQGTPGTPAQGSWEAGVADYKAIKNAINSDRSKWKLIWDKDAKSNVAYGTFKGSNALWTYNDERAICEKVKYVTAQGAGGVFAWESNGDDGSLLNIEVRAIKDGNIDCQALYPDSNYDEIFTNTVNQNAIKTSGGGGGTITGNKLTDDEVKKAEGNRTKAPSSQTLPSGAELKEAAKNLILGLPEAQRKAMDHLTNQLKFDRSVLTNSRSLSRASANVDMVKSVISRETFSQLFPIANSVYNYDAFIRAVKAFPMLCGETGQTQTQCKEELASIFGNFAQETSANLGDLSVSGRTLNALYVAHTKNPGMLVGGDLSRTDSADAVAKLKTRLGELKISYTGDASLNNIKFVIPKWRQGLYAVAESNCRATSGSFSENDCSTYRGKCSHNYWGAVWKCPSNTKYYGRGSHQLTHNYNYGRFGSFIWGANNRQKLVDNPNYIIDKEPWMSMLSATWFHMYSTGTKPSMHDVAIKAWTPGTDDVSANRGQTFGTIINVINGGIECGKVTIQATTRGSRYKEFRKYLGLADVGDDFVKCDTQKPFSSVPTNSGNAPIYYDKAAKNTCKLVKWETGFNVYDPDYSGYAECVKFHWGKPGDRPASVEVSQGGTGSGNQGGVSINKLDTLGAWTKGFAYKAGDIVDNGTTYYQCKPAPYTPWCKDREPGKGNGWAAAWNVGQTTGTTSDDQGNNNQNTDQNTTQNTDQSNNQNTDQNTTQNTDQSNNQNANQNNNQNTDQNNTNVAFNQPTSDDSIDGYENYANIGALSLGAWSRGFAYAGGDIVKEGTIYYQCKPAPYTSWCKDRQPVTGNGWAAAWNVFTGKINMSSDAVAQEAAKQASLRRGMYSNGLAIVRTLLGTQTTWGEGYHYVVGDIVDQDNKKYSCRPFPASGWCGERQPVKGNEWADAWELYVGAKLATPADLTRAVPSSTSTIPKADYIKFAETLGLDLSSKLTDAQYNLYEAEVLKHTLNSKLNIARASVIKLKDEYASHSLALADFSELEGSKSLLNLDVDSSKWPANVKRVKRIMPEDKFNYFFPLRDSKSFGNGIDKVVKPNGSYSYKNFLNAAAFYPKFCNEAFDEDGNVVTDTTVLDTTCKKALSGMFAHFAQEVGGHDTDYAGGAVQGFSASIPAYRQGLFHMYEMGCNIENPSTASCGYRSCDENLYGCASDPLIQYMGRGAKQLSYNYNYIKFGQEVFGFDKGDILKNRPNLIAEDGRLALLSAFFFYMTPQPPKPSMHEIDTKAWVPNDADLAAKRYRGFGASVMVINAECVSSGKDKAQAQNRFDYYRSFMKDFGVESEIDASKDQTCVGMKQFDGKSSSSYLSYWEKHWTLTGVCQLVSYQTKYSAFQKGTYKECVKDKFFNK